MSCPFETFEHTADVGIDARGASLPELFASAAVGMLSVLIDPAAVRGTDRREVRVTADDLEALLVNWLNELLVLLNAEEFVPSRFEITRLTDDPPSLDADISGEPVDPTRHRFRLDVKAATYHQLRVSKNEEWRARVILDV